MQRLLVLAAAAVLTACGGDDTPTADRPARPKVVTGTVELERPLGGSPDGGTSGGHRAPDAIASTSRSSLVVRGKVAPAHTRVLIRNAKTRRERTVPVEPDGRFAAQASALRRGPNAFVIQGRADGYRPWSIEVSITRR